MALAAQSRRQVFAGVKDLIGTVSGLSYQPEMDPNEAASGALDDYYSLTPFSDEPSPDWRSKTGTNVAQVYTFTARLAKRFNVKERETTRLEMRDVLDDVQRALYRATDSGDSPLSFQAELRASRESQNNEREWLFVDCDIRITALFDLTVS